jgi:DNA-binding FadR family transcriptional regulator
VQFQVCAPSSARRALVAKGVVEVRLESGIAVAAVEPSAIASTMNLYLLGRDDIDYASVHEVRRAIEVEVADLAAERATDEQLEHLNSVCEEMARVVDDVEACSRADVEFHRTLAKLTQNDLFLVMLDSIGDVLLEVRRATVGLPGHAEEGLVQHHLILPRWPPRTPRASAQAAGARR